MLANLFKLIYRDLTKDKTYTTISILGLSAAISISIIIIIIIISFLTYDKFHEKGDRIYQAFSKNNALVSNSQYNSSTSCLLGGALANQYPDIKNYVTVSYDAPLMFIVGENFNLSGEQTGIYSENSLFEIFSFPLLQKNSKEVFKDDNSIAISRELAIKYFTNTADAIGKRIVLRRTNERKEVYVSSVFDNIPNNSSLKFDYVLPLTSLLKEQESLKSWGNIGAVTYFELNPKVNVNELNEKVKNFLIEKSRRITTKLFLYKYEDIFLKPPNGVDKSSAVIIYFLFAFSILSIAAINFVNLATARATKKIKEISIRKIIGAKRKSLIFRFLTESFILSFMAIMLGLLIAELLLPYINKSFGNFMKLSISYDNLNFIIAIAALWFIVGLLSGLYPSFHLSAFSSTGVLKGITETNKRLYLRKVLITVQFIFSTLFIFIVVVLNRQIKYITDADLGFNTKQIIGFSLTNNISRHLDAFTGDLKSGAGIIDLTYASQDPMRIYSGISVDWEGKPEGLNDNYFSNISVGDSYLKTFDMQIIKGRDFLEGDSLDRTSYIINEAMAKVIGKDNPVGLGISAGGIEHGQIVGVIKDFQNSSLHSNVVPLIIMKKINECGICFVKVYPKDMAGVLSHIEKNYKKYENEYPFKYYFLNDQFLKQHIDVLILSAFFNMFSTIAIIISCMGLFGITAFTIQQKTKEIGIRKILGASVSSVSFLLTKSIIKLVLIGALIALPLGFYLTNFLLQMFVHRTKIGVDIYLISVGMVLVLAAGTVISQALRAAFANPVESLKYE